MAISTISYKGFKVAVRAAESMDNLRWYIEISIKSDSVAFSYLISEPYVYTQKIWFDFINGVAMGCSPGNQLRRERSKYVFEYADHHSNSREFRFDAAPINKLLYEIIEKASLMGYTFSDE